VSAPRPDFPDEPQHDRDVVEVDYAALPDDWREGSWRLQYVGETRSTYANRVRAQVAEGLAPREALSFSRWLDERGAPDDSSWEEGKR
jgi:hypothetical protein